MNVPSELLSELLPLYFQNRLRIVKLLSPYWQNRAFIGNTFGGGKSQKYVMTMGLENYSEIEWGKISRFRDLVSHHYENVDYEIVYDICKTHIPKLGETIEKIKQNLQISHD